MSHTTTDIFIYRMVNKVSGKSYVGITNSLGRRFKDHSLPSSKCSALRESVKKYGIENFYMEALGVVSSIEEAAEYEKKFISLYGTLAPNGYNLTSGGEIGKEVSAHTRHLMSIAKAGKESSFKGKKHSDYAKMANSEKHKGRKQSEETRKIYSEQRMGNTYAKACRVVQMSGGVIVNTFKSIKQAAEITGIHRTGINGVCRGIRKSAGGYLWSYSN